MRCFFLISLFLISLPAGVGNAAASQDLVQTQAPLVRKIEIKGFVLQDKGQFVKLFKPYRNKLLSADEINAMLQELAEIYEQAGYQGLVSIRYEVKNKVLTFTVSLIK